MSIHVKAPDYDVAIVGGGVSGIYTGWRLLGAAGTGASGIAGTGGKGPLKVAVFEKSDRVGGRLLSARPPGMPHVTCELGGMRYVSTQPLVRGLIENELKLPRHEQIVHDPANIAFLRGQQLRVGDLSDPGKLPYHVQPAEAQWVAKNAPPGLIGWAIAQILPGVQHYTGERLHEYLRSAEVDGTSLYQHGFWNLLARTLSHEAYELATKTVGYDSLGMNVNAVDLTAEYFNFAPDVKYFLVNNGFDMLPWTLEEQFQDRGGSVHRETSLRSFGEARFDDSTTGVALRFEDTDDVVTARAIVLAMPRRAIELLEQKGPVLNPEKAPRFRQLLGSVDPVSLYKLNIVYDYPWWEARGVKQGRSLTDTPLRQCYYWAVEGEQFGANPDNTTATVMAYNDMSSSRFWAGLRRARGLGGALQPAFRRHASGFAAQDPGGNDFVRRLRRNWDHHEAPADMVAEIHRQLMCLHDVRYAPEPIDAAYMEWSDDPYGGGVHYWNVGYKSWELIDEMTHPVAEFPCYVCGEAFSTRQTWVEGALQTAEIVLQKHFGLERPAWVG